MKLKGSEIPRNLNPANPLKEEVDKPKQLYYYVNFDATLATYNRWKNIGDTGEPIPKMKQKVLSWIQKGIIIKIFTARAYNEENKKHIRKWLILNGFPPNLEITNIKGIECDLIFDDKAREVIHNTGIIVDRTNSL